MEGGAVKSDGVEFSFLSPLVPVSACHAGKFFRITAPENPGCAQAGEALRDVHGFGGVTEVTRGIVDKDRGIDFGFTFRELGSARVKGAHRNADTVAAFNVDAA